MNEQLPGSGAARLAVQPSPYSHPTTAPLGKPKDDLSSVAIASGHPTESKYHVVVPGSVPDREFKRPANVCKTGAVRVKSFHGRLTDDGLHRLDEKINEWLEVHPEIEVKFAVTSIGKWNDKSQEPAMIINVWW
jgi:hypothetical protein